MRPKIFAGIRSPIPAFFAEDDWTGPRRRTHFDCGRYPISDRKSRPFIVTPDHADSCGVPGTAALGEPPVTLERHRRGRLQNGGYLHSGSQNLPVRARPQTGYSLTPQGTSTFGAKADVAEREQPKGSYGPYASFCELKFCLAIHDAILASESLRFPPRAPPHEPGELFLYRDSHAGSAELDPRSSPLCPIAPAHVDVSAPAPSRVQ